MTLTEAKLILGIESVEDGYDAFEEHAFAIKQFFVSKPILQTTFRAKLKKLSQLQHALAVLNSPLDQIKPTTEYHPINGTDISSVFEQFQFEKNKLKLAINNATHPTEIIVLVEHLMKLASDYYRCWKINTTFDTTSVIMSKEPDPMELLAAINTAKIAGLRTFEELADNLSHENPAISVLQHEAARCSMIYEKEKEWTKS